MEKAAETAPPPMASEQSSRANGSPGHDKKRKYDDPDHRGGRDGQDGRRNRGRGDRKALRHGSHPNKKRNMGRNEHFREHQLDRRGRNEAQQAKIKEKNDRAEHAPALPAAFPTEEIEAEERRPKRKVAVMLGYSGTGYKGMQIDNKQKTIEGDLFHAFVKAGAISKANADDPKKSSLVRCARTDKGVHAAGNVISLKLIIEEDDIVEKINSHLSSQIRIWGIQRTTGSFSCYQACDSRWYEYLIPTHSFLPPHPSSFMAKKLEEFAEHEDDLKKYHERQAEVANFWPEVEEKYIKPVLDSLDDSIRPLVEKALYAIDSTEGGESDDPVIDAAIDAKGANAEVALKNEVSEATKEVKQAIEDTDLTLNDKTDGSVPLPDSVVDQSALETAIKTLKRAYLDAKKAYRISPERHARVKAAFQEYVGTRKYHNYTVQKKFSDKSAQRFIRSFEVSEKPIIINDTEWLSLKVHGQSFMMHQIRKMVGMAALTVRCGANPAIMQESFEDVTVRIPKAPGLGLLLERPVFDSYNKKAAKEAGRENIDFSRYEKEIEEFKEREIYQRIFREEAEGNQFHSFFTHLDNYRDPTFLYLTSGGIKATKKTSTKPTQATYEESEDESGGEG